MKYIVTTTIFPKSNALKKFEAMGDWKLIVVGDKKTPHEEYRNNDNIIYLDPEYQETTYKDLSDLLGWNCIQRRNIGYVEAYKRGASIIASIDDDNIPLPNWGTELYLDTPTPCTVYSPTDSLIPVWDPLSATNYPNLWHRGYPIDLITKKHNLSKQSSTCTPTVQADFWDGDPDVDAIERMVFAPECTFDSKCFPFSGSVMSPFNSQNTFFTRNSIQNFFLFPYVGRMDDIWGSYYAQAKGETVLYNKATVVQERNVHNYLVDFSKEVDGYLNNTKLIGDLIKNPESIQSYIPDLSYKALLAYNSLFK